MIRARRQLSSDARSHICAVPGRRSHYKCHNWQSGVDEVWSRYWRLLVLDTGKIARIQIKLGQIILMWWRLGSLLAAASSKQKHIWALSRNFKDFPSGLSNAPNNETSILSAEVRATKWLQFEPYFPESCNASQYGRNEAFMPLKNALLKVKLG